MPLLKSKKSVSGREMLVGVGGGEVKSELRSIPRVLPCLCS